MKVLKRGHKGEDVRYLQYILNMLPDGSFGPATEKKVKEKQEKTGLIADGIVGPATQKAWGIDDFRVYIYDKSQVWFAGTPYGESVKPLYNLKAWAVKEKADYVFNLAFFNMKSVNDKGNTHDEYGVIKGRTVTYLKAKGYDVGYGGTSEKLTVNSDNVCAGYKVGIVNGKAKPVSLIGKRARNANGQLKDGRYFHVQSVTTATEHALVQYMLKNYDVDLLLIQDAGGSTGFYDRRKDALLAGEREVVNGRAVASVVCVKEKAERPIITIKVCPCCGQEVKE